jgi:L-aspartate oxidase
MKRIDLLWEETEQLYHSSTVSPQLFELRNLITVAYLITKCAEFRKESRGLHYNTDYPEKNKVLMNIIW